MYHEAVAAPARNFDAVLSAVAKDKSGVGKPIEPELVFEDDRAKLVAYNCLRTGLLHVDHQVRNDRPEPVVSALT